MNDTPTDERIKKAVRQAYGDIASLILSLAVTSSISWFSPLIYVFTYVYMSWQKRGVTSRTSPARRTLP